jgi:hypothetical protein
VSAAAAAIRSVVQIARCSAVLLPAHFFAQGSNFYGHLNGVIGLLTSKYRQGRNG